VSATNSNSVFHTLVLNYGSTITIPDEIKLTDTIKNRLICYIQSLRVECKNDAVNQQLTFKFNNGSWRLSSTGTYFLYVYATTSSDDDITKDGVIYNGTDSKFN